MPSRSAPCAFACLLALAALAVGCGGDSGSSSSSAAAAQSRPAPPKGNFPSAGGRSLREVLDAAAAGPSELVVSPAARAFYKGPNRYPFGVFERDLSQVPDAEVALYFAKAPPVKKGKKGEKGSKAAAQPLDQPARGPFPASIESLATKPAFRAQTTADDPRAASVVYAADVDFPSDGDWSVAAVINLDGKTTATLLPSAEVGIFNRIPRVGEKAPLIHTPVPADVGGDLSKITTRIPPDTQNEVDYADVLGKEPIMLLFATPQFCQSRVCGPVVDVAEQLKQLYGDEAAFIHMEIRKDNDPNKGIRPQVRAFHLPTEPWLFAIDREGRVRAAVEGAFGLDLMTKALKEVTGK